MRTLRRSGRAGGSLHGLTTEAFRVPARVVSLAMAKDVCIYWFQLAIQAHTAIVS